MRRAIVNEAIRRSGLVQQAADVGVVVGARLFQALITAGVPGDVVIAAAAAVTGFAAAPRLLVVHPSVPGGIDPTGVRDAGGVPIGTVQGRAWIAFSDPDAARAAVFSDDVVVCLALPDDLIAARAAFDAAHPPNDDASTVTVAALSPAVIKAHLDKKAAAARDWDDATAPAKALGRSTALTAPTSLGPRVVDSEEDLFDGPSQTALKNALSSGARPGPGARAVMEGGPTTAAEPVDPSASTRVQHNPLAALPQTVAADDDDDDDDDDDGDDKEGAADDDGDPSASAERLRLLRLAQLGRLKRFQFVRALGGGAMATVYLATDKSSGASVAVKILDPRLADEPLAAARFARELRALRTLDHPHVTSTIDGDDSSQGGVCWVCCPHLDGGTLAALLQRTGAMPLSLALPIVGALLEGVGHAHERGVLHRDLKPQNVLLSTAGDVQIADFGLARVAGDVALTTVGVRFGTPAYMAPEQARGDDVDARADLFAVGVIAVELLTGRHPFARETPQATIAALARAELPRLATLVDVPAVVDEVVARLCARDRAQRFDTAADAHALLQPLLATLPAVEAAVARAIKSPSSPSTSGPADADDDGMALPPTFAEDSVVAPGPIVGPVVAPIVEPELPPTEKLLAPSTSTFQVAPPIFLPAAQPTTMSEINAMRAPGRAVAVAVGTGVALAVLVGLVIAWIVL